MFWWVPSGITFCQSLHWQIRDGDSHKVQKVLICFTRSLECIVLMLPILPIVLGFVCIQMLVAVVHRSDLTVSNTHDFSVAAVSGGDESELARHRRQGHIPFNQNCLECAKGRSVFQHRRDKGDRKEVSIQADFAFLNTTGEIVADELPGSVKILVLTEMMSRCIGYVVVGEDVEAARRHCCMASTFWLDFEGSLH